ncbi:TIGR04168 family protein [Leptolyngbya sp. 'hensonii']|uniref:TIGR04168 family protein n=1 Tax=Leptolyngbya sp. 'hensonii' TaxID=1922337 RepID=UPI00094FF84F|nr:TIGR04168 family protein [Leptolyngbya sp. 'hensonii']OLP17353.1 TIGR04168 family protein [Leptolyngbya sp. 'hensonii']
MTEQQRACQRWRMAVVGDVHDLWDDREERALRALGVDLVLLVGDFGNEAVPLVRSIAALDLPKAVILGNHDAWYTASDWGRKQCPYDPRLEDRVQQQLDLLGETHVGYGKLDFPQFQLSIVGGRPFSWGGSLWKNGEFYQSRFGVGSFAESTARIVAAAQSAAYETLIILGHCGPTGLGNQREDPCGRDWEALGGDHGDPDLEAAIDQMQQMGKTIPLVTFGHMHHQLRHTQDRLRRPTHVSPAGTLYLNAAYVPRLVRRETGTIRHFTLVEWQSGDVLEASLVWLDENFAISRKQVLFHRERALV